MERPIKPDPSDCCQSDCNPCILDVYEHQLKKYEKALKSTRDSSVNCLSQTSYSIFRLTSVEKHTKDTFFYTFAFVKPEKTETLIHKEAPCVLYHPSQYFMLKATVEGESLSRAYTPINVGDQKNQEFTVLIKLYENGKMSKYLKDLDVGKNTLWRGPYGDYVISYHEKYMLFIAQGTGIAPIYTIICDLLQNEECFTFLKLFFCCDHYNVLLRDELYALSHFWNFTYQLFVNNVSLEVKYNETVYSRKLESKDLETYFDGNGKNVKVLICGSVNFSEHIKTYLRQCGVEQENIFTF
ncbi:NADH-cytochrome b5 reductase-like [Cylas formicarius]|uniref:NADH-cytochrome b5 reductase-like n=1 Tax=Cylas formicarius TaxID=197179 RepID=UPI00295874C5|nr:NADH-cytochrome b5 reductase-like [Cylas formicarius]